MRAMGNADQVGKHSRKAVRDGQPAKFSGVWKPTHLKLLGIDSMIFIQ